MFHYRGAWGSHGAFSFSHAMEDTMDMLAYMRTPSNATRLGIDPGASWSSGTAWADSWRPMLVPVIRI